MILSICILCKNEPKYLPRLLDNLLSSSVLTRDKNSREASTLEVLIGDTGSDDGVTKEIIDTWHKNFVNVRQVLVPWHDDFSQARNDLHHYANGDWILWADADMKFSGLGPLLKRIRNVPESVDALVVTVIDDSTGISKRISSPRIIRNRVGSSGGSSGDFDLVQFKHRIHENPQVKSPILDPFIIIHDREESPERRKEKSEKYRVALEREVAEHPEEPAPYSYLLDSYFLQNKHSDVVRLLNQKPVLDSFDMAIVARIQFSLKKMHEAAACCRTALHLNPYDVRAMVCLGDVQTEVGEFGYAKEWYEAACKITWETLRNYGDCRYSEEEIVVSPRMALANLYANMGMVASAEKVLAEVLEKCPHTAQAPVIERNLQRLRAHQKKSIILQ